MSATALPRQIAKAMAAGRAVAAPLVIPLAFRLAARIQERPVEEFLTDPTQLANGLRELFEAIGAGGIVCALDDGMECEALGGSGYDLARLVSGERVSTSLEATRRLRATLGDKAALVAGLTGPATLVGECGGSGAEDVTKAGQAISGLARQFCEAGADIIIIFEKASPPDEQAWRASLQTLSNIVRFYRGLGFLMGREGPLPQPTAISLGETRPGVTGLVVTPEEVPATTSIEMLRSWVGSLR